MAIHLTPEANPTVQEGTLYVDSATGEFNVAGRTTPHIIPGVLYPSYVASGTANKLLDGTTSHSGNFGTEQSDGRKYYYTNIAGSKPIKDPRIGGHFGSQRHKFKSLQLLEQETATHSKKIYSTDGRDWIKLVDNNIAFSVGNSTWGNVIYFDGNSTSASDSFIEITGYFNDFNMITRTGSNRCDEINAYVNGGNATAVNTLGGRTTHASPLDGRYVDSGSIVNIGSTVSGLLGTTPKINTLKLIFTNSGSEYLHIGGIELIAQDTTSTANKSKIQIPSQNVVSYGKKFTVSGTPHYDPFNGFTSGSSVTSYIDTATSLGVENWKNSSTYYRPYNGGRVVKWVDSSGVIKTSVTLMPPNARSIGNSSSLTNATAKANASIANNTFFPTIEAGAIDHSLAEVAKTFHFREFGNGSANGETGHANYADASMLNGTGDNIAYVMDDGLTSFTGENVQNSGDGINHTNNDNLPIYITFIGTGFTVELQANGTGSDHYDKYVDGVQVQDGDIARTSGVVVRETLAQNLPYGTHMVKLQRGAETPNVYNEIYREFTFHQPKRPPIPEDAVVLADYMLMADFVVDTGTAADIRPLISKGVRYCSSSRDVLFDVAGGSMQGSLEVNTSARGGLKSKDSPSGNTMSVKIPFFGTNVVCHNSYSNLSDYSVNFGGSARTVANGGLTAQDNTVGTQQGDKHRVNHTATLGLNEVTVTVPSGGISQNGFDFQSPIHTSSHYQSFETPFLHELVGGDRNMEQTNLVVSPDGKSWDEITRDTSYIGSQSMSTATDTAYDWSATNIFDQWRGVDEGRVFFNKDWAIAYDRIICLRAGQYRVMRQTEGDNIVQIDIIIGSSAFTSMIGSTSSGTGAMTLIGSRSFNRGDAIRVRGENKNNDTYGHFQIERL